MGLREHYKEIPGHLLQAFKHSLTSHFSSLRFANMPRSSNNIDAKADTVIVLRNSNSSFAPWTLAEVGGDTTKSAHESIVNNSTPGDADQGAPIEVAIAADDTIESNPANTDEDECWCWYRSAEARSRILSS
jgi:hypothetical protein